MIPRWLRSPAHAQAPPPHPLLGRDALARWLVSTAKPGELEGGFRPLPGKDAKVLPLDAARRGG